MAAQYRRVTLCKQKPFEASEGIRENKRDKIQEQVREHNLQKNDKKDREIKKCVFVVKKGGKAKELDNERRKKQIKEQRGDQRKNSDEE